MEPNTSSSGHDLGGRADCKPAGRATLRPAAGHERRRAPKATFNKEYATLWLLTLTLGLGLGAVVRVAQRSQQASATGQASQLTTQSSVTPTYGTAGGYSSQRVMVFPQQSFGARGTTRMS